MLKNVCVQSTKALSVKFNSTKIIFKTISYDVCGALYNLQIRISDENLLQYLNLLFMCHCYCIYCIVYVGYTNSRSVTGTATDSLHSLSYYCDSSTATFTYSFSVDRIGTLDLSTEPYFSELENACNFFVLFIVIPLKNI